MNKVKFISLAAGFLSAMAFTFSCSGEETLTDSRDGKVYKIAKIGKQVWMAENLNYDGDKDKEVVIEALKDHSMPYDGDGRLGKCYNNEPANCEKYGRLYDWAEAMGSSVGGIHAGHYILSEKKINDVEHQGICPLGWHLPNNSEWETLYSYIGNNVSSKLKAKSDWKDNKNGTDDYGFSALPGGLCFCELFYDINIGKFVLNCTSPFGFNLLGSTGFWWTATEDGDSHAKRWNIEYSSMIEGTKVSSMSVRCVKNKE
jgi:uncharacterized protein (TIGR02145 family)